MNKNTFKNLINAIKHKQSKIDSLQEDIKDKKTGIVNDEASINTLNTSLALLYHRQFPVTIGQLSDALAQTTGKDISISLGTNVITSGIVPNVEDVLREMGLQSRKPELFVNITLTDKENDNNSYEADYIKFSTHLPSIENVIKFGYTKFAGSEPNTYDRSVLCINSDRELPINIDMKTIYSCKPLTDAISLISENETSSDNKELEM